MKIAMIGQRGIPAVYGGIDASVEQLSLRLANKGHDVTVFCRGKYYKRKDRDFMGVKLLLLPAVYTASLETPSHVLICSLYASLGDYDVVHFHGLASALFSFIPRLFLKKSVLTVQGLDYRASKWGIFARLILRFCEWASVRFPNQTIVVSKALSGHYRRRYKKIVRYVPNGAQAAGDFLSESAPFASLRTSLAPPPAENGHLLYLGRLAPQKGIHYLIEAFRGIDTDRKLIIAGGSSYTDRYMRYIKNLAEPDKRVIFTGPLYGAEKEKVLSGAYLFILPSEIEGLSLSLLEAMGYGKCCLVSDIPENLEAIGTAGVSFRAKDMPDLRARLEFLLSRPDLVQEAASGAKSRIKEFYDWEKIAGDVEKLY